MKNKITNEVVFKINEKFEGKSDLFSLISDLFQSFYNTDSSLDI